MAEQRGTRLEGSMRKGSTLPFSVAGNPSASGAAPWYELPSKSQVGLYDYGIESLASETGVDANLIRSVMYVETTHGYYDAPLRWAGINRTILPMNVHADYWSGLGFDRTELQTPYYNIKAGALILRGIQANLGPGASIAQIGTLYNNLYAPAVTNYGARVAEVYRTQPW